MEIVRLKSTESTNTWMSSHWRDLSTGCVVITDAQTAGRGQRGNSWESEPGKNLTFSMFWCPEDFPAVRQFEISEIVSLALVKLLSEYNIEAKVKWPNDIYVGDRKIAGILIEHAVAGRNILHTIIGIGLNVNQAEFMSDAPNPVSMFQLTGRVSDLQMVLERISELLWQGLQQLGKISPHSSYMSCLWRGDGKEYPFITAEGELFKGIITDVAPDGRLSVEDEHRRTRTFLFKEVSFLLEELQE